MNITVEKQSTTTIVAINRPAVKNAVDGPTAAELAAAFRDLMPMTISASPFSPELAIPFVPVPI